MSWILVRTIFTWIYCFGESQILASLWQEDDKKYNVALIDPSKVTNDPSLSVHWRLHKSDKLGFLKLKTLSEAFKLIIKPPCTSQVLVKRDVYTGAIRSNQQRSSNSNDLFCKPCFYHCALYWWDMWIAQCSEMTVVYPFLLGWYHCLGL